VTGTENGWKRMQIHGFDERAPSIGMGIGIRRDENAARSARGSAEASGAREDSDGLQLSKLSSVLNGLENGASAIRRHALEAMQAVRTGTYNVDAAELSKRIVGEALGPA
jgi:anti-sigma28 factor (negative regulator of flagellin synthesis)